MPLYLIKVQATAVVVADDAHHAHLVAGDNKRDILSDVYKPDINVVRRVQSPADLEGGWDTICIPYGGDGNTRIGELLSAALPAHHKEGGQQG